MNDRRPETASQSERAVLALALRDPEVVDEALLLGIESADFATPATRALWDGVVLDRRRGVGPDEATVLERHEDSCGPGRPFVSFLELSTTVTGISRVPARRTNLETYTATLREFRARRALLWAARMVTAIHEEGGDSARMREEVEGALLALSSRTGGGPVLAASLLEEAIAREGRIRSGHEPDQQLRTGLTALDRVLAYHPGHYGLVAGRPGMGKTQFALTAAQGIARRYGPVLFVSVEMGADSMARRLYSSSLSGEGDIEAREANARNAWASVPLHIDHEAQSLAEVCSAVRMAQAKHGIVAFVVDYLQKMQLPRGHNREQEIARASEALSTLCGKRGLFGMVLSQLNRGVDNRADKRPVMADLRESGSLEQDADSILFVYREVAYNRMAREPDKAELILAKQRNGRAGVTIPAWFRPGDGWFREWSTPGAREWGSP